MSGAALLSAVITRIDSFRNPEQAPAKCGNGFMEKLEQLVSELRQVELLFQNRNNDADLNKKVIGLAHDIENAVERRALQEQAPVSDIKRVFNRKTCLLNSDIRKFRKRIEKLKFRDRTAAEESITSRGIENPEKDEYEDDMVGLESELRTLLLNRYSGHYLFAIVGMSGLGKTMLARKLFNDKGVRERFDRLAWVCVTHKSDMVSVFKSVLKDISGEDESCLRESELKLRLHQTLFGRRCLVVLDDVWSTGVWEKIKPYFPNSGGESRVVITTRDEGVARSFEGKVVIVPYLTDSQSEELLIKKLNLHRSVVNKNVSLRSTMDTIISLCRGLPSEIIQVINILKGEELEDWDEVVNLRLLTNKTGETSLLENIALSYDYLEPHLKPCFLYLGQFPLDQQIPVEKLYLMWMAEGLASCTDIAEKYLKELIDRNLVLDTSMVVLSGGLVSCQLHDMTRKLCILKGKAEGCVGIVDSIHGGAKTGSSDVYLNGYVKGNDISSFIHVAKHIRALIFSGHEDSPLLSQWSGKFAEFENFECTRVLDFDGIDFRINELSIGTGKLVHLRYLGFKRCYLEEFLLSFRNFPYLETLDLRVRTKVIIPNVLSKMSNLKHLFFPVMYECKTGETGEKLKLDGARNLEVIENFHAGICDVDDLLEFTNLQTLKVLSDGENIELRKLINNVQKISESRSLNKSSLVLKDFDCYSSERQDTLEQLVVCCGIHNLYLEGCIKRMPAANLKFAKNFTNIVLDGTEFRDDPMLALGYVANLKSLVLCNDASTYEEICCRGSSFPLLESLEINNLQYLEHWVREDESMPNLIVLRIKQCNNLETFPEDLMEIPTFSKLKMGSMPKVIHEIVREMAEKQKEMGNVLSIEYES